MYLITVNEYLNKKNAEFYLQQKIVKLLKSFFSSKTNLPDDVKAKNLRMISENTPFSFEQLRSLNYIQLFNIYRYYKNQYDNRLKQYNINSFDYGKLLVDKLDTHEKLHNFIIMWRKHFIETMKPKYLPIGWKINYRTKIEI